jgi:hypothetical protein
MLEGVMTDKNNDKKTNDVNTEKEPKAMETCEEFNRLVKMSKKVPHPGTVKVTIFPNPRK